MRIAFAPDGMTLVTTHMSSSGSVALIWNTSNWISADAKHGIKSAAFSKDGKILALGGSRIELIDPATQKQIRTIELAEMTLGEVNRRFESRPNSNKKIPIRISALTFSPDGKTIAAGCEEGTVRLVKMKSK